MRIVSACCACFVTDMGALLSIPLIVPGITGLGGWMLSCCGAAAVFT